MRIVLGGMRLSGWQELEALFTPAKGDELRLSINRLPEFSVGASAIAKSAARAFETDPSALCVVGYATAEEVVATALFDGAEPGDALDQWRADCALILALMEAFPLRTALLHVGSSLAYPALVREKVGERLENDLSFALLSGAAPPARSPLLLGAACAIVREQPGANDQVQILDKSALMASGLSMWPGAEEIALDAIAALLALKEREKLATDLAYTRDEYQSRFMELTTRLQQSQNELVLERAAREALADQLNIITRSRLGRLTQSLRKFATWARNQTMLSRQVRLDADIIRGSEFFDESWYVQRYPDVAGAGIDPALHFAQLGGVEARAPGPRFCSFAYLAAHPEIREKGINPLVHYLRFGQAEGLTVEPVRDQ